MNDDWGNARLLFYANGVPVKVRPSFWPMWLSSWPALIWLAKRRGPERPWSECLLLGTAALPIPITADVGHALAHTVSARLAGAPMDEIRLAADMPRTIYFDSDISPDAHRIRASGGPVFSGLGFLLSLLLRCATKQGTAGRELADIACASHGFLFAGSLMPLKIVDGGTLLKWTLIDRGSTVEEADNQVKRAGIAAGLAVALLLLVGIGYSRLVTLRKQKGGLKLAQAVSS